jgi:hypothetical protein
MAGGRARIVNQLMLTAVVAVVSALLGGGVWSFASAWLQGRFNSEQSENSRLHEDLKKAIASHEECREKVVTLERRLEVVEHHHVSLVPRWIKNAAKRVQWVNGAAMVTIFGPLGFTRGQVEGHTFAELLDMEAAREIDRIDRSALRYPGQAASTLLQLHPSLPVMTVVKIAGVGRDGELIYEGLAYYGNIPEDLADRAVRRSEEQMGASLLRGAGRPDDDDGDTAAGD